MKKEEFGHKKLSDFVEKQIKSVQKQILDITEVSINPEQWKPLRSKILGITNDMRRELEVELNKNYNIEYDPEVIYEDVVQISSSTSQPLSHSKGVNNGKTK